jgi:hypothetical protein
VKYNYPTGLWGQKNEPQNVQRARRKEKRLNHRGTAQQSCNQKNEISTADYTDVADKEILLAGNLLLMGNRIKDKVSKLTKKFSFVNLDTRTQLI